MDPFSLPPCGGGSGGGYSSRSARGFFPPPPPPPPRWGGGGGGGVLQPQCSWLTPLPSPPPQGGREQRSPAQIPDSNFKQPLHRKSLHKKSSYPATGARRWRAR